MLFRSGANLVLRGIHYISGFRRPFFSFILQKDRGGTHGGHLRACSAMALSPLVFNILRLSRLEIGVTGSLTLIPCGRGRVGDYAPRRISDSFLARIGLAYRFPDPRAKTWSTSQNVGELMNLTNASENRFSGRNAQ